MPLGELCLGRLPHSDCLSSVCVCVVFVSVPQPCSVSAVCLRCRALENTGLCWILLLYLRSTQNRDPTLPLCSLNGPCIRLQQLGFFNPVFKSYFNLSLLLSKIYDRLNGAVFWKLDALWHFFWVQFQHRGTIKLSMIISQKQRVGKGQEKKWGAVTILVLMKLVRNVYPVGKHMHLVEISSSRLKEIRLFSVWKENGLSV